MIVINELHGGRFGNKILHYNNLVQIAKTLNIEWDSLSYDGYSFLGLKNNMINKINALRIDYKTDIYNLDSSLNYELIPCLGDMFFKFNYPTREFFSPEKVDLNTKYKNIGIHFRGGDFHTWNPQSILSVDYYIDSIEYLHKDDNKYYLFTDDLGLSSYKLVIDYLESKKYNYEFGMSTYQNSHFIYDYYQLCECDYIISSPSTFAICAGFMGKEKEIIHSKKWVESRVDKNDEFWVGVNNGGNLNYKIKKII